MGSLQIWLIVIGSLAAALVLWYVVWPLCALVQAWLRVKAATITASRDGRVEAARAKGQQLAAEAKLQTARLQTAAKAATATAAFKAQTIAEQRVIEADAATRVQAAKDTPPAPAKPPPRLARSDLFWNIRFWANFAAAIVIVVGAIGYGIFKYDQASTRPHQATILVCKVSDNPLDTDPPKLETASGSYYINKGTFGATYYPDPSKGKKFFGPNRQYAITFHGIWPGDRYVIGATELPNTEQQCAGS
ncbi:MAG TPA: hypothetical protein VMT30_06850 [Candidatus Saccharimonadia bacterium]|nr:hypothetical protein [Candidatus Saccharimonadia bacterium]